MRERPLHQGCVMDQLEARFGTSLGRSPGEVIREPGLVGLQDVDGEPRAFMEQVRHTRAPVDGDEHERRAQRDRHERVRGHPVHLLADAGRKHGHAGGEHAQSAPESDRRIALEVTAELQRPRVGDLLERSAERLGRRDRPFHRDFELLRGGRPLHVADSAASGLVPSGQPW